jgi:16S rRNA (guanine(966)-N(2))-methyltransferase RsmD
MRVITGSAKGRKLQTLPGEDVIRPTSQRVKEALFSAVQFMLEGRVALDAFAGSGQLGLEALSRGAAHAVFCEKNAAAMGVLKKNVEHCGLADRSTLHPGDAIAYLCGTHRRFDFIFLDPPYGSGLLEEAIPAAGRVLAEGGVLACLAPVGQALPDVAGEARLSRAYPQGKTKIVLYRMPTESEAT